MKRIALPKLVVLTSILGTVFGYGIGVGHYHWPPFAQLYAVKNMLLGWPVGGPYRGEAELLEYAFTEAIIPGEKVFPPIRSLDGIRQANDAIFMTSTLFYEAYENIMVTKVDQLRLDNGATKVIKVEYTLGGRSYTAYAYGEVLVKKKKNKAALIIPGSGENQSHAIYNNDRHNYHYGILDALGADYEIFVVIKPNEDVLAFHDGRAKMNESFIVNWQLNRGSSYSASYITQSLAIAKYLKIEYDVFVVAGLSQGGAAALLCSLQSEPDAAIIASGYSVVSQSKAEWSSFSQIIIPHVAEVLAPAQLMLRLSALKTRYLFTWGTQEIGVYKMEAQEHATCLELKKVENAQCCIHEGGHVFPVDPIRRFLSVITKD